MDGNAMTVAAANDGPLSTEDVRAELHRLTEAHQRRGAGAGAERAALAEILQRAKSAHAKARVLNGVDSPSIDNAARVVFVRAKGMGIQDAAGLLLQSERNWSNPALVLKHFSVGAAMMNAQAAQAAANNGTRDLTNIYRVLQALGQRGVRLEALPSGKISAAPKSLITDVDRRILKENWRTVYEFLVDEETFGA
jgi:hypothetical protein